MHPDIAEVDLLKFYFDMHTRQASKSVTIFQLFLILYCVILSTVDILPAILSNLHIIWSTDQNNEFKF